MVGGPTVYRMQELLSTILLNQRNQAVLLVNRIKREKFDSRITC